MHSSCVLPTQKWGEYNGNLNFVTMELGEVKHGVPSRFHRKIAYQDDVEDVKSYLQMNNSRAMKKLKSDGASSNFVPHFLFYTKIS